ncbi:MAG: spore coat U domain-containing protein, partial [Desulfuromonadales bacterium]|nr:spore coat U domain-containing protein [Desulfuromonadales bacterium]
MTTLRALPYIIILLLTFSSSVDAAKCSFTAANINFGTYNIIQTSPNTTTGTINVSCNPAKPVPVTITLSTGSSGNYAQRELSPSLAGVDRLRYNIFTDASYSTIFGNGTGGSQILLNTVSRTAPWNVT